MHRERNRVTEIEHREEDTYIYTHISRDIQRERKRERQRDREKERDTYKQRDTERENFI